MTKIVELRQDRNLMRTNFDGYKLSLDSVPLMQRDLTAAPHKAELNDEQYSFLHAELFAMQNLLHVDPWARTISFFINRLGEIVRSSYNENTGRPEALQVVFRISNSNAGDEIGNRRRHVKGDYNYSMRFISEKYCVLCDGMQTLFLLDTGDRLKAAEWKEITRTLITTKINDDATEQLNEEIDPNFMIYDCRLDIIKEQKEISIILGRVGRKTITGGGCSHYLYLHWAKWILNESWTFTILDTFEGKGSLYYCAFEPRAESVVICSNREYQFRSQKTTNSSAIDEKMEITHEESPQLHDENIEMNYFTWTQSDDDIILKFYPREGKQRSDYDIQHSTDNLNIKCANEILLDAKLFDKVDDDLTTWTFENDFLQIFLVKKIKSLIWPSLLIDGLGPKEISNDEGKSCLSSGQQPILNLEAPIEDCDFPIGLNEDEIKIVRFNFPTKSITHTVILGSTPPLFATSLRPGFPLAIATRQDVDACLWLQQYNANRPDEWSLRHEGNLHAFGYIQASKQQKKFIDCSPDLNYALICESYRHLFLYKSNYDSANCLRNRSGPQVTIGKQHLITLEEGAEVLGLVTAPSVVTLLTEKSIFYLQIN